MCVQFPSWITIFWLKWKFFLWTSEARRNMNLIAEKCYQLIYCLLFMTLFDSNLSNIDMTSKMPIEAISITMNTWSSKCKRLTQNANRGKMHTIRSSFAHDKPDGMTLSQHIHTSHKYICTQTRRLVLLSDRCALRCMVRGVQSTMIVLASSK